MNLKPSDFGGLCFSRVVIVGANGAGKTRAARALAQQTGSPIIHKDAIALLTGWRQRPKTEVRDALAQLVVAQTWIVEGGPSVLCDDVLGRATLVVWLQPSALRRGWRIFVRSLRYMGRTRPEHPPGNRDWPGLRQWRFLSAAVTKGDRFDAAIKSALAASSVPCVRLKNGRQLSALLEAARQSTKRL